MSFVFGSYVQYDSRWGSKSYNGSSNYSTAACGPSSVSNIIYAINKSVTPVTIGKYMQNHGYAIRNQGTAWAGIPAALKAFGAHDVKEIGSMDKVWKLMAKGYVGVFLFTSGSRGGICWTSSGHYIAVTDYKVKNGKHYIYTRDSGGRGHTGWYCYETQMKGLIASIWLCSLIDPDPIDPPKETYDGKLPTAKIKYGSKGSNVKRWQNFLNFYHPAWKVKVDGKFGTNTEIYTMMVQANEGLRADGIVGNQTLKKAKTYLPKTSKQTTTKEETKVTTNYTNTLPTLPITVSTTYGKELAAKAKELAWPLGTAEKKWRFKTGAPTSACKKVMKKRGYKSKVAFSDCGYFQNSLIYAVLGRKVKTLGAVTKRFKKVKGFKIVHKGKIGKGVLKAGDIIRYKKTHGQHVLMYVGNGVIAEAGRKTRFGRLKKSKKYNADNVKKSSIQVLRAIESTKKKAYLSNGDNDEQVKLLKEYLNWVGGYGLEVNKDFDEKCESAVKDFQSKYGLDANGVWTEGCNEKAKTVVK